MRYLFIALLLASCAKDEPNAHAYDYEVTCRDCRVAWWDPATDISHLTDTLTSWGGSGIAEDGQMLRIEAYPMRDSDTAAIVSISVDGVQAEMDWALPPNPARTHHYIH